MIWQQISERVAAHAERVAVVADGRCWTFGQVSALAAAVARRLPSGGGTARRRFLVRQRDPFALLIHVLGCWRAGCVPVVLRDSMTDRQVADLAAWLRPEATLSDGLPEAAGDEYAVTTDVVGGGFDPRDEALVICTSGTTGSPKLVALPAESVCRNALVIGQALRLDGTAVVAVNTPLGYMYGLMGGCMASLWAGATCCLFHPRAPLTELQAAIRRWGVTVVQGPPSLFRLFMAYWNEGEPFTGVRVVTTGGEPLGDDLRQSLGRAFPNALRLFLYGMTEAGPRLSHLPFDAGGGIEGRIGTLYPHVEWRIDPIGGGPAEDCVGRLVLRGPAMFLGYVAADGGYEGLDADGFFHSNDLVQVGPGRVLTFRGRLDRIFRSGGRLVNPDAVERVLEAHPAVGEASCFPVPHPVLGLVLGAEVLPVAGVDIDEAALLRWCSERVESHALPRRIVASGGWEVAESGKRRRPAGPAGSGGVGRPAA